MSSLPAVTRDKDQSLQAALDRMISAHELATRSEDPDPAVTTVRKLSAAPAQFAPFPDALEPRLAHALAARGIDQLYTHQAEAITHALGGQNVVIITPTASGKTLCYNAPVLDAILK